jgi:hypothetical protein
VLLLASVAETVLEPPFEVGTVNVTFENEPEVFVVSLAGEVARVTPSNFMVIAEEAAKPLPETVTVEPTAPLVGFKLIAGDTVNEAVGEFVPSLTRTVLLPELDAGTVNVADKPPAGVVVEGLNGTDPPLKVAVTECEPSKPVPVTVSVEPTIPEVGVRLMAGVTVNEAEAVLPLASVAEIV